MKREVHSMEETVDEVVVCDYCGLEADRHLVPLEEIEDHLSGVEARLRGSLEALDAPDIPEPVYTEETRHVSTERASAAGGPGVGFVPSRTMSRLSATVPLAQSQSTETVREYTGISTDEAELIERAEELEKYKQTATKAVMQAMVAIERISKLGPLRDPVDICDRCHDRYFGWDE